MVAEPGVPSVMVAPVMLSSPSRVTETGTGGPTRLPEMSAALRVKPRGWAWAASPAGVWMVAVDRLWVPVMAARAWLRALSTYR